MARGGHIIDWVCADFVRGLFAALAGGGFELIQLGIVLRREFAAGGLAVKF